MARDECGLVGLFWALGRNDATLGLRVLGATFLVTALIAGIGSRGRHLSWVIFAAIALAAWMGAGAS